MVSLRILFEDLGGKDCFCVKTTWVYYRVGHSQYHTLLQIVKKFQVLINYIFEPQGTCFTPSCCKETSLDPHLDGGLLERGRGNGGVSRFTLHSFEWFSCVARNKDKKKNLRKKKLMRSLGRKTLRATG